MRIPSHTESMVIALEGLPGVGKTTAAGNVARALGVRAVMETTANHPFLRQVYDDADRDDLTTELAFLLVHANPYRRLSRDDVTVCDFSPAKDELFAEEMLAGGDLHLFEDVYRRIYRGHELPDVAVLLQASPELCLQRVRDRMVSDPSRAFEEGLTLDRLERMAARYERDSRRLGRESVTVDVEPQMGPDAVTSAIVDRLEPYVPDATKLARRSGYSGVSSTGGEGAG